MKCLMMKPGMATVASIMPVLLMLVLFSGCVQPEEGDVSVSSEQATTEEWVADGIVGVGEYSQSIALQGPAKQGYSGGQMKVSWNSDGEHIYMALDGATEGWVSIGFDPSEWMKDADVVLGWAEGEEAVVLDEYSRGNYGPHLNDTELGGTYDILEYGGRQDGGRTVIEFKRRLDTGDRFDKAFTPGQSISAIWAMDSSDDRDLKHSVATGELILSLSGVETAAMAASTLSQREADGVLFIWEEEKVARDLYLSLYDENRMTVFRDLAVSEQNHMDSAGVLIEKYGLQAPGDMGRGVYSNETLNEMYDELLAKGRQSPEDALRAAATFEEISIVDLEKELDSASNEDVRAVFGGLLAGSRKHLRSYVADLREQGITYEPQYVSPREFEDLVSAS